MLSFDYRKKCKENGSGLILQQLFLLLAIQNSTKERLKHKKLNADTLSIIQSCKIVALYT
jgi:hypothetical protein